MNYTSHVEHKPGVTLEVDWSGPTMSYIDLDKNLKTGVIAHPKHWEIVLNDAYLSFAEHYQAAIMSAEVRKPKQKPRVGGPWARWMIANLVSMGFVNAATNLIITRATGAGKTYLIGYLYFET